MKRFTFDSYNFDRNIIILYVRSNIIYYVRRYYLQVRLSEVRASQFVIGYMEARQHFNYNNYYYR